MQYKKYDCIKGQNWLAGLPLLRELFVNHGELYFDPVMIK